ncbi:hypothetical protein Bp8pS_060 [Bacillus phage vB_BpuM-BpSp]|nr:hypothetical protein Bp8pS_060 [Bacillus phage vB_BpuM-BpSp]
MNSQYSHKELSKQSNLSFLLLKEIMNEEISTKEDQIFLYDKPLRDNDDKKMLIYSLNSKNIRRKNKKEYSCFNPFLNSDHLDLMIDLIYKNEEDIDCIEIEEESENKYSIKVKNISNNIMKKEEFYNNESKNKSIMNILLNYYEIN